MSRRNNTENVFSSPSRPPSPPSNECERMEFRGKTLPRKISTDKHDIRDVNVAVEYDPKRNVRQRVVMRNVYVNNAPFRRRPRYPWVASRGNITPDNLIRSSSLVKYLLSSSSTVVGTLKTNERLSRNCAL